MAKAAEMAAPKILVFCCQWAMFPGLEEKSNGHTRFIFLPCGGRTDTAHIVEAIGKGIDGVFIATCGEDDCKLEGAGGKVQRPVEALQQRLAQIECGDRVGFCNVSPRYPDVFDKELSEFSSKISKIVKGK